LAKSRMAARHTAFHGVWGIVTIDMLGYRKYPRQ
jgi:hypothetical protein